MGGDGREKLVERDEKKTEDRQKLIRFSFLFDNKDRDRDWI